jgi:hypothetical protein
MAHPRGLLVSFCIRGTKHYLANYVIAHKQPDYVIAYIDYNYGMAYKSIYSLPVIGPCHREYHPPRATECMDQNLS